MYDSGQHNASVNSTPVDVVVLPVVRAAMTVVAVGYDVHAVGHCPGYQYSAMLGARFPGLQCRVVVSQSVMLLQY